MDLQEKIRNDYTIAQDYAEGVVRPPATPAMPGVLSSEGGQRIAPDVLYNQDS